MAEAEQAIVIIKRIKKGGHGHHGGAWKVAFADFAVAMMAFFMLLWLLATTTPEQKASISSYFNDPLATVGLSSNGAGNPALDGGDGILDGSGANPFTGKSEDEAAISHAQKGAAESDGQGGGQSDDEGAGNPDAEELERLRLEEMLEELRGVIEGGRALEEYADQLIFDITVEGLRIQIVDKENRAMFDQGSAILKSYAVEILSEIVKVINDVPNRVSISGHTDTMPYSTETGYSNWELSADRANAARRSLLAGGLPESKIGRVVGLGPSDLLDPSQPQAPINRRISIVVLRGDYGRIVGLDGAAPDDSMLGPDAEATAPPAETAPELPPAGEPTATAPALPATPVAAAAL